MAVLAPSSASAVHRTGITLDQATSVVFLNLNGIFYNSFQAHCDSAIKMAQKLFPDVVGNQFSDKQGRIAETHLFNQEAVAHLETLVHTVNGLGIVISSLWRFDKTVADLKEILAKYTFSAFIIDKTPDGSDTEYQKSLPKLGHPLTSEITYWLKRHPSITNFVIYEGCDSEGLAKTFGDKFIEVDSNKLLTQADVNKALAVFSAHAPSLNPVARPKGITLAQAKSAVMLDIDGVLYNRAISDIPADKMARKLFPDVDRLNSYQMDIVHAHLFKQDVIAHLETLIYSVDCLGIVISSRWRIGYSVDQLKEIFAKHTFSAFIIGKTPDSLPEDWETPETSLDSRILEIKYWLKQHPWITKYAVYDDYNPHDDLSKAFGDNFILVDSDKLLTQAEINKALRIFGVKV